METASICNILLLFLIDSASFLSCETAHLCVINNELTSQPLLSSCNYRNSIDNFSQEADKYSKSNTTVTFFGGHHNLTHTWKWNNVENVILRANGRSEVIINCSPHDSNGFVFENVSMLSISSLHMIGCGSNWTIRSNIKGLISNVLSALSFINGSQLTLTFVSVSDAKAAGLYIYNVAGNTRLNFIIVTNASSDDSEKMSGNIILYDIDVNSSLAIENSVFSHCGYDIKNNCSKNITIIQSSGLALIVTSSKSVISISATNFYNNKGCNGGNIELLLFSIPVQPETPVLTINNTILENGFSNFGGGLYASFEVTFLYPFNFSGSSKFEAFVIENSTFRNNIAKYSGGGIVVEWQERYSGNVLEATICDSVFYNNSIQDNGGGGLALHYRKFIQPGGRKTNSQKFRVNLEVSQCSFFNHSPSRGQLLSENSVILADLVPYLGIIGSNITSNNCTAILTISAILVFKGSSLIRNNTSRIGAGIRFCSNSLMYLAPHTTLIITDNNASETGGGIHVHGKCLMSTPLCFFQYIRTHRELLETVNVTISGNHAVTAGDNLFGGSIDDCYNINVKHNKSLLHITPKNSMKVSSISSKAQHVCFKDSHVCGKEMHKSVYPGESVQFEVQVVGQLYGPVPGTVRADSEGGVVLNSSEDIQTIKKKLGGPVHYVIYSNSSHIPNNAGSLTLRVIFASDSRYTHSFPPAVVNVTFKPCPFGFSNYALNGTAKFACQCKNIKCSIYSQYGSIEKNYQSWVGMFETHLATSRFCPLDYCNHSVTHINSTADGLDQDHQCNYYRTGLLCGSCHKGFSLIFGTSECRKKCSNWWLFLVIPFALAGIFLVFIITFLNLTVTTGTVCGLIFYANVIQGYSVLLLQEHPVPVLSRVLQIFIAWLNLDLGIPTCFYDGMQAFGKTALQAVFPVYIWLISAVIIFLSNRYISITRLFGQNAVKVLATLILLSYSKMLRVTIGTLNKAVITLHVNNTKIYKIRWILDGNVPYFNPQDHLILIIMAIIFLILTLPFALSLLCIRHVFSLSNCCRIFSWVNKLKPFFDAYTGPCKDSARFWTGLLLVTRFFLLLVHAFNESNRIYTLSVNSAVSLILCMSMIALNGVYKKKYLNILESSFILNIGLVFISLVALQTKKGAHNVMNWKAVVGHTSVGVALLTFLGILALHIYQKCSGCKWIKRRLLSRYHNNSDVWSCEGIRGYQRLDESDNGCDDSTQEASADSMNRFLPLNDQY